MLFRRESSSSIRSWTKLVLVCALVSCKREPTPVPQPALKAPAPVAPAAIGGAPQAAAPTSTGGAPGSAPSTVVAPVNKNALSLQNVSAFTAKPGQFVTVPYVEKLYDEQNQFDKVKHAFKAAKANSFQFCASLASLGKDFDLNLFVNGVRDSVFAQAQRGGAQGCRTLKLKANDMADVRVEHTSGEPLSFQPNDSWNWMNIQAVVGSVSLDSVDPFVAEPNKFTKVQYTSKTYDADKQFDVKTNRFTAVEAGDYRVCSALASPSPDFELDLFVNGQRTNAFCHSHHGFCDGCRTVRLAKGQFFDIWTYPAGGGAIEFKPKKFYNWMTVDKISTNLTPLDVYFDNTTSFSAAQNVPTKVRYSRKAYDDRNQFDAQNNRFTAAEPRDYRVCASLTNFAQDYDLAIAINGVREKGLAMSANGFARGCRTVRLKNAGDFLELQVVQSAAASVSFNENSFWDWLTIEPVDIIK
jgi:hypothetical protein